MSSNHLDKLSKSELEAEKSKINALVSKIVIGTLVYAAVVFYFMYNGNRTAGNFLLAVPIMMFVVAYIYGSSLKKINTELNKRR